MALIHSLEKNGNFLFKYRGQIPVLLFISSIPVVLSTNYSFLIGKPNLELVLLISCISVSMLGQIVRAIAIGTSNKHTSGRNTKEQVAEALNTQGIYSTVRHPLYLGNYFMWLGIVLFTFSIWFVIAFSLFFWLYYERIMFAEERFLERKFGENYLNWSLKVPAFMPSFKNYQKTNIPFSLKTILRREYSGVTATIIGFLFVDIVRNWNIYEKFHFDNMHLFILILALLISLILRSLKHYTKVLHEEDRS
jgi:protein-S-isoprenylcysteine O-methyltransferase Ste14